MDVLKLWLHAQMQPISLEAWLGLDSAGTSGLTKLLLPRSHSFSKDWTGLYFFKWCQQSFKRGSPSA